MLRNSFLHVPGIGYVTERKLWQRGFISWQDYFEKGGDCPLPLTMRSRLELHLEESVKALTGGDARYFEMRLPAAESWRLYPDFTGRVAFLDIETTGLYAGVDVITIIGLFDGQRTKVFIRDINLPEFEKEIQNYSVVITFNGKRFDIPFIRRVFGGLPPYQANVDLMYPLKKLGYRGGLKAIEKQMGVERDGALKEVDGFMAVLLWREYQKGNRTALDTLIRYNLEDVVNLRFLADMVYNAALQSLPISIEPLPVAEKYAVDTPFDAELIHYLSRIQY